MREVAHEERAALDLGARDPFDPHALAQAHGIPVYTLTGLEAFGASVAALAHFTVHSTSAWSAALVPLGSARVILENESHAIDAAQDATGPLTATYYANDMVASLSQSTETESGPVESKMEYGLDPAERIHTIVTNENGAESARVRYNFSDSTDSPSTVETSLDGGASWAWERYLTVPGLGMAMSTVQNGSATLQLADLHGNIVATQANTPGSDNLDSFVDYSEFGSVVSGSPGRYGWKGAAQRSTDAPGGQILMGVRVYAPETGLFLSPDPVRNGGGTVYGYPWDPVNACDLDGRYWRCMAACLGIRCARHFPYCRAYIYLWLVLGCLAVRCGYEAYRCHRRCN
ncbi:MAG: RHS repeat-associated core domain-containing protein [Pseudonocardiaceae bacterium]